MRPPRTVDKPTYEIVGEVQRYDQRDSSSARLLIKPGTPEYEEYYSRRPQTEEYDKENRRLKAIAYEKKRERDRVNPELDAATFYGRYVLGAASIVLGTSQSALRPGGGEKPAIVDPEEMAKKIKAFGMYLGAARVGIARLKQEWVYTNFAHPYTPEPYGKPVELQYENIICMAQPMEPAMVRTGQSIAQNIESNWTTTRASMKAIVIAQFIRCLGWRARAITQDNMPLLLVPALVDAGIGEQGRHSIVISKEFGGRFYASAVVTDLPLALDKPVDFGVQDFCEKCLICAEICPGQAITRGGREVVRGIRKWQVDGDKCRRVMERRDLICCLCQAVCPWNHTGHWFHNTMRDLSESFPSLRKLFIRAEKAVYGKFKLAPSPWWVNTKGTLDRAETSD